jgi:hypothetical protein
VAAALFSGTAMASPALPDNGGFAITSYDVKADISDSNIYDVAETIQVNFAAARHGIIRDIPMIPGGFVSDVSVEGYKYSVEDVDGLTRIRIGDPDEMVEGEQTYRLHYKLNPGEDGSAAYDEVYFNIIGTGWSTTIDKTTFSITLPKPFDASKLGFSLGVEGSSGYKPEDLKFSVDGNMVSGTVLRVLNANEGLTMRLELPQGYFTPAATAPVQGSGSTGQEPAVPEPAVPGAVAPDVGPDQGLPVQVSGMIVPGAIAAFLLFFGFAAVVVIIVVVVVVANRSKSAGGMNQSANQAYQNMLYNQSIANRERMRQNFPPPPPPPPPPPDMGSGGGFSGGGGGGGGGGSW